MHLARLACTYMPVTYAARAVIDRRGKRKQSRVILSMWPRTRRKLKLESRGGVLLAARPPARRSTLAEGWADEAALENSKREPGTGGKYGGGRKREGSSRKSQGPEYARDGILARRLCVRALHHGRRAMRQKLPKQMFLIFKNTCGDYLRVVIFSPRFGSIRLGKPHSGAAAGGLSRSASPLGTFGRSLSARPPTFCLRNRPRGPFNSTHRRSQLPITDCAWSDRSTREILRRDQFFHEPPTRRAHRRDKNRSVNICALGTAVLGTVPSAGKVGN